MKKYSNFLLRLRLRYPKQENRLVSFCYTRNFSYHTAYKSEHLVRIHLLVILHAKSSLDGFHPSIGL
jgi:hypothetical protein